MKVILLKDVPKVGHKYEVKNVADGFVLNVLMPRGDVLPATPENLGKISQQKKQHEGEKKLQADLWDKMASNIADTPVIIHAKTSPEGHLFAAIHPKDIIAAMREQKHISLEEAWFKGFEAIKTQGVHHIEIKKGEQKASFKVEVEN
ncbi:MAG: 50S ribosomal protein L9 [bacterium]